jgi:hypothetical protein
MSSNHVFRTPNTQSCQKLQTFNPGKVSVIYSRLLGCGPCRLILRENILL